MTDITATVQMPSTLFISIVVAITDDGGAHPNTTRYAVLLRGDGTPVTDPAAVFRELDGLANLCFERLKVQVEDPFEHFEQNIRELVFRLRFWSFSKDRATLLIDPYAVAAYVYGPQDLDISYDDLQPYIEPDFYLRVTQQPPYNISN